jgi:hypothetical protein
MTSTAISAQGTTLEMNTGTTLAPVLTPIKNMTSFSGFSGAASDIDVTDLDSTAKEYRAGLQDWDSVSLDLNINMAEPSHVALLAAKKAGTVKEFTATLSDGTTIKFTGYVKDFPIANKVDAVVTGTVDIKVTGDITVTPPVAG